MKIKKGDTVKIIVGKDAGASGKVIRVFGKKQRVLVEGLNKFKKHVKKQGEDQPGGIVEMERPIHISNVAVVEHKSKK
jgi:large subunit ribosomal protein L24